MEIIISVATGFHISGLPLQKKQKQKKSLEELVCTTEPYNYSV